MLRAVRDVPPLPVFAQEVARQVGGTAHPLDQGEYPSWAIEIGGQHLLLLRDHKWTLALSLPTEPQWNLATWADWITLAPQVVAAVSLYRSTHPQLPSMADAMLALGPELTALTGQGCGASFPGTPDPREGWLRAGGCTVGVFQESDSVRVVVWISGKPHSRGLPSVNGIASLRRWAVPLLVKQLERGEEVPRPEPSPQPSLDEVLTKLRAGARIQDGGGRYYSTYFIENGRLRRCVFDEGHVENEDIDPATLQAAIARSPDQFR